MAATEERLTGSLGAKGPFGEQRIAYVVSRFPKVTETFVLQEMLAATRRGFDLQIYPLMRSQDAVQHAGASELEPRVRRLPFLFGMTLARNLSFAVRRPLRYLRAFCASIRASGGSLRLTARSLATFPKAVAIAAEVEREGVEQVHAHFATHPTTAALVIHHLTGIPYSFTAHGSDLHVDPRGLKVKLASAKFSIAISDYNKQFALDHAGHEFADRIKVRRLGVEPSRFKPSNAPEGKVFKIACVAALRAVKGHEVLIEACRRLDQRGIAFECVFAGEGPRREALEKLVQSSGLGKRIRFAGAMPSDEVIRLLDTSHAAVLASVIDASGRREGIPVSLMEAMAMEVPVVASRLSGIPELIEDQVSGWLFEAGDSLALAEALERLAKDAELRHRLGKAGRQRVCQHYDFEANASELFKLFEAS